MKISAYEIGYLAGMLDGEGSVLLYRNSGDRVIRLVIQAVTSTNALISEKVQEALKSLGVHFGVVHTKPNLEKGFRGSWAVQLRRIDDQKRYIEVVGPFVAAKNEHLRLASIFLQRRSSNRKTKPNVEDELLIARMKELNSRGLGSVETVRTASPESAMVIQSELTGDSESAAEMTAPRPIN